MTSSLVNTPSILMVKNKDQWAKRLSIDIYIMRTDSQVVLSDIMAVLIHVKTRNLVSEYFKLNLA